MHDIRSLLASVVCTGLLLPVFGHAAVPALFDVPGEMTYDESFAQGLQGRILLQVEEHGEAYYVHEDGKRYYMKDGAAAYEMMRSFGLGITNSDLDLVPFIEDVSSLKTTSSACTDSPLANRLRGKILLQVEQHGEAWYVDPERCRRIYMKDGDAAYSIMRELGLGISNDDLMRIEEEAGSVSPLAYLEDCTNFTYTTDGITTDVSCELEDVGTTHVSVNTITREVNISFLLTTPLEETYTQDPDGTTVSFLPIMTNLFCELMGYSIHSLGSEVLFDLMGSAPEPSHPFYYRFHALLSAEETGEPLAECAFREQGYENISFTDHQNLQKEDVLFGVLYGDGESSMDFLDELLALQFGEFDESFNSSDPASEGADLERYDLYEQYIEELFSEIGDQFDF